jgi:hypothetical protein
VPNAQTCEECGERIEADDEYVEVAPDDLKETARAALVHAYLCLLTYRVKHPRH